MNTTPHRSNGLANTPEEEMLLIYVGLAGLGVLDASAGTLWFTGANWLVEHHVLIAAAAHPTVQVPGAGGAGLDGPRLVILVAVILAVLVIAISAAKRAIVRRREDLT